MNLRRDDDVLARHLEVLQRLAGDDLRLAVGVDVGGIDEIDARIERTADELVGVRLLKRADVVPDAAATAAEGHRAEAEFRNE